MARPREFEIDKALDGATEVFWRHGYDGAALPDLLAGMGISRGSFYKAFADKRSVYLACLDRYEQTNLAGALDLLTGKRDGRGRDRIATLFGSVVRSARIDRRGCFLTNAAIDRAPFDPDVEERVLAMMGQLAGGFAVAIADDAAAIDDDRALRLGEMLATYYVGLQVTARAGARRDSLQRSIDRILALIEG